MDGKVRSAFVVHSFKIRSGHLAAPAGTIFRGVENIGFAQKQGKVSKSSIVNREASSREGFTI